MASTAIRQTLALPALAELPLAPPIRPFECLALIDAVDRHAEGDRLVKAWTSFDPLAEDELIVVREIRESGNLYVPWPVVGQGELILCTASLMERKQPYHLPVELARGTLNRLRNQAAAWQMVGMDLSPDYRAKLRQSQLFFARAANEQAEPLAAADDAERALQVALEAINILSGDYVRQVLTMRHQQTPQLPTLLAGNVESEPLTGQFAKRFRDAFNSAAVPLNWRDMEREQGQLAWDASDQQMAWWLHRRLHTPATEVPAYEHVLHVQHLDGILER